MLRSTSRLLDYSWISLLLLISLGVGGCAPDSASLPWIWDLPDYVSPPLVPEDNPMSITKVELGRYLFYEKRLSWGGEFSCESCHIQERSFTVSEATHQGAQGEFTSRNTQSLANIAFATYLTWGNLTLTDLEQQMLNPLFGDSPVELGAGFVEGSSNHYDLKRLRELIETSERYRRLFARAFPDESDPVTWDNAIKAIACFQRALISLSSPWDRWLSGDLDALTAPQERGRQLFFSDRLRCGQCHAGPLLSLAFPTDQTRPTRQEAFRNTGLYYLEQGERAYLSGHRSTYPPRNQGIGEFSQRVTDDGKHRIPSLKNIALTAPYMHDGSIATLDEVIDHYQRGGRLISEGPWRGDGRENPYKDPLIAGFDLSDSERADLKAFLQALTDMPFIQNPRWRAPVSFHRSISLLDPL